MSEIHMLIPKKDRPVWPNTADVLPVEASDMVEVPLLGWVAAGQPIEMFENHESVAGPAGVGGQNL